MTQIDLHLLERWQNGWSLARGRPLPTHHAGGLVVEVGLPDQLRRHLFVDAGSALRDCAAQIHAPYILLKAARSTTNRCGAPCPPAGKSKSSAT